MKNFTKLFTAALVGLLLSVSANAMNGQGQGQAQGKGGCPHSQVTQDNSQQDQCQTAQKTAEPICDNLPPQGPAHNCGSSSSDDSSSSD